MTEAEGYAARLMAAMAARAGIEDTVPPRTKSEWSDFLAERGLMAHMNDRLDSFGIGPACESGEHWPTEGWWCKPRVYGNGTTEAVWIFRRGPGLSKSQLRRLARHTFALDDTEMDKDFGFVTLTDDEGKHFTLLSFDVEYLEMMREWEQTDPDASDPEINAAKLDKSRFDYTYPGWPEEWPNSGLKRVS